MPDGVGVTPGIPAELVALTAPCMAGALATAKVPADILLALVVSTLATLLNPTSPESNPVTVAELKEAVPVKAGLADGAFGDTIPST